MTPWQFYAFCYDRSRGSPFPRQLQSFKVGPFHGFMEPISRLSRNLDWNLHGKFYAMVRDQHPLPPLSVVVDRDVDRDNVMGAEWMLSPGCVNGEWKPCEPPSKERIARLLLYA